MDSPSIVPELSKLAELVDLYADADNELDIWNACTHLEEKAALIAALEPTFARLAKAVVDGTKFSRRQADNARKRARALSGSNRQRNINMATECIKRRRDPAYDYLSDTGLMGFVGALSEFDVGKTAANNAVVDGLSDPLNKSRIRESAQRGRVGGPRSIFDGSKRNT
jgi:hypothetical protein